MTNVVRSHTGGNLTRRAGRVLGFSLVCILGISAVSYAGLVNFQAKPWNPAEEHLKLNGQGVQEEAPATTPGFSGFTAVTDMAPKPQPTSYGFSGGGANDPDTFQIYQHVASWTLPGSEHVYDSQNTTGHNREYLFTPEDLGVKRKYVRFRSNVILDGSLLFVKDPSFDDNKALQNMVATFEVLVTRENGKKAFFGSVELIPRRNGKVAIRTRGKIRKRHITEIIETDTMYEVVFDSVPVSYLTRVKLDEEFQLNTAVSSRAVNVGDGTGAEVIFGPGSPTLPDFQEDNKVPEPSMIAMLSLGGAFLARINPTRRKKQ